MKRKIVRIDEKKCNGCGICVTSCHEGAIAIDNGKAKLVKEDLCDGLGQCIPKCPQDAIYFETTGETEDKENGIYQNNKNKVGNEEFIASKLSQWPVQLKLIPVRSKCFSNANLLVAADCSAFAYGNFHNDFIKGNCTVIGCPKLEGGDHLEKLTEIIKLNDIKKIKVVRMEIPCCFGLEEQVKKAVENSGKNINVEIIKISCEGNIVR